MSEADQYPDPDLSFLEGATGSDIAAMSVGLDAAAQELEKQTRVIAENAEGATVDRVHESLVAVKQELEKSATHAGHVAAAFREMQAAWETWKATAPRQAAIAFAERSVADARQRLMKADGMHAALLRPQLKMAEAKLTELIEKRKAADAALAAALVEAGNSIPPVIDPPVVPNPNPVPAPPALGPAAPGPAASAPAPGGELPGTSLPGATLPPGTGLSAMPETAGAATGSGSNPNSAAAALAALAAQQQQSQQPVQIPQPQMAPAAPQQQKPAENPFGGAGDPIDLAALLGPAAMGALAGAGAPALSSTIASPALTPLTPAGPTFTPLNPTGLGGATPANPVVQPVVTGTSTAGLVTDSNVTGRADGTAARTATSPGPASHLSAAGAEQATGRAGAAGTGTGTGMGGVPMMGGPMGGMGGSGGKDRTPVTAEVTPETARLIGLEAIAEAVPGGTIAQKRDDAA